MTENLTLCVFVWARPGKETGLIDYEGRVLRLLPAHGAQVVQRAVNADRESNQPTEVQMLEFPSPAAFRAYLKNPRRRELAEMRNAVVERTCMFPVDLMKSSVVAVAAGCYR